MPAALDLAGQQYGDLTAVRSIRTEQGIKWLCTCECGGTINVLTAELRRGHVKSCGCDPRSMVGAKSFKKSHGYYRTRTYNIWSGMKARCNNPKASNYDNYGGRGISVCERWYKFENFLADMGEAPEKFTIDRIDNNGNYEPANCRWATMSEQLQNRRPHGKIPVKGLSYDARTGNIVVMVWDNRRKKQIRLGTVKTIEAGESLISDFRLKQDFTFVVV